MLTKVTVQNTTVALYDNENSRDQRLQFSPHKIIINWGEKRNKDDITGLVSFIVKHTGEPIDFTKETPYIDLLKEAQKHLTLYKLPLKIINEWSEVFNYSTLIHYMNTSEENIASFVSRITFTGEEDKHGNMRADSLQWVAKMYKELTAFNVHHVHERTLPLLKNVIENQEMSSEQKRVACQSIQDTQKVLV